MSKKPLDPALVRIVEPIVRGHTRALVRSLHPEWFPKKQRGAIVRSLSKRIVADLCCEWTRGRLIEASVGSLATTVRSEERQVKAAPRDADPVTETNGYGSIVPSPVRVT